MFCGSGLLNESVLPLTSTEAGKSSHGSNVSVYKHKFADQNLSQFFLCYRLKILDVQVDGLERNYW
jgi:hypothetical protein